MCLGHQSLLHEDGMHHTNEGLTYIGEAFVTPVSTIGNSFIFIGRLEHLELSTISMQKNKGLTSVSKPCLKEN